MAGIYIHIPFCKQACIYCNFHFATSLRGKNELVAALLDEMAMRQDYLEGEQIETIYIGGGTPSLLTHRDLEALMNKISSIHTLSSSPEITIETNPDDFSEEKIREWRSLGINRVSVGVQSFFDEDLKWMNRAHSSVQASKSLEMAVEFFNTTVDLIYGFPLLDDKKWKYNVDKVISLNIPHVSCYALTVEARTPLFKMIREKNATDVNADDQSKQFLLLMEWMEKAGYEHYEISNFAKPGFRSRHNSAYWSTEPNGNCKKYLGIGPSAHSFDGLSRQWNVSNNQVYINSIRNGRIPSEKEILSPIQRLNEYIMTSLRTMDGLDLKLLDRTTNAEIRASSERYLRNGLMVKEEDHLKLTREGKLLADGIASDLFF